ncbi:MAG TPA: cysteine desulfurase-like protein [Candidatus Paceibacterota bacterium]|nr:cysteine desulfurase-like protein [Verrucomicrobiota bacterium]HSA12037.1 cysteine desulfurase-like protein [Candidatus Paceibacterota bacterium]
MHCDSPKNQPTQPANSGHALASIEAIRGQFPALARRHNGNPVAYFDGPGGTQVPRMVVEAMTDYLLHHNANTHWSYPTSAETDAAIASARQALADFFNASPSEVAFGNNMTTITFHLSRALGRQWGPGDEVVVTELDHQANVAPWRALARERGVTIRSVPFHVATGELIWDEFERTVTDKTRLVAIGAASNALGTVSPVCDAARLAHKHGALCCVDAVHYAAHQVIDVKALECDFLVCSPYKFYGPHAGVLYGRADVMAALDVPKLDPAPDTIPDRMETGTQNHEGIVGSGAAVEFIASLAPGATRRERLVRAMTALHARGDVLLARLWGGLSAIPGVQCYGPPPGRPRTPTVSFAVAGIPSAEVARALAREGVFASNGNFYATTVVQRLGHTRDGLMRAGCASYTTEQELDRLIEGVHRIAASGRSPG